MKKITSKFLALMVISVSVLFALEGTSAEAKFININPLTYQLAFYWNFNNSAVDSVKTADLGLFFSNLSNSPSVTGAAYGYVGGVINQAIHLGNNSNTVGAVGFTTMLISSIKQIHPDFTISFYIKQDSLTSIPNPWKHVVIRSIANVDTVYIDNNVITDRTALDSWISGNITLDELRVYSRSLLDSEVSQLNIPVVTKRIHSGLTPGVLIDEIVKDMQGSNLRRDDLSGLLGLIAPISSGM